MRIPLNLLCFVCTTCALPLEGQTNFRAGWEKANPIVRQSTLGLAEKVKAHQGFLDQATREKDALKRLYGFLYLFYDYADTHDFPTASRYLLEAENLAKASGDPGWQGWVAHRRGVLSVRLKNYQEAITPYETAATLCATAGDSLGLGESLEQLGAMYDLTKNTGRAEQCFERAIPLLRQYGADLQLASALNNYGNFLLSKERPTQAIVNFENAMAAGKRANDQRQTAIFQSNLAAAYGQSHLYDRSLKTYRQCILISREKNWLEDLLYTYEGISGILEATGQYRESLDFYKQYHSLQDSLIGATTQLEIADLEARYHGEQNKLALQKSQSELATARLSLQRGVLALALVLLLVAFGLWRWRLQSRLAKSKQLENQENLTKLTRILLEKNKTIKDYEEQLVQTSPRPEDLDENIYDQRILTSEDWTAFKSYFNKAYPGYMMRLRATYPNLSDAELRLFLFIKLKLNRKEAATILGISPESVKKTRNRLRHRLGLGEEVDLDAHVLAF